MKSWFNFFFVFLFAPVALVKVHKDAGLPENIVTSSLLKLAGVVPAKWTQISLDAWARIIIDLERLKFRVLAFQSAFCNYKRQVLGLAVSELALTRLQLLRERDNLILEKQQALSENRGAAMLVN